MKLIYLTPVFIFAAGICHGENFMFKDGSQITGTLKSVTAQTLEIETSSGVIKMDRNDIALIDFSKDTAGGKITCKKTYYTDGSLHTQAYYLDNKLHGLVKIYGEGGQLLLEQNFKAGIPDGFQREYDKDGSLKSELFYRDGRLTNKPVPLGTTAVKPVKESPPVAHPGAGLTDAQLPLAIAEISVKTRRLARGTRYTFYRSGKYIGTQILDKNYNVTRRSGKIPDGVIRTYFKNGLTKMEMVFLNDSLNGPARFYDENGKLEFEVIYKDNRVIDRKYQPAP